MQEFSEVGEKEQLLIAIVCAQHGHLFRMKIRINLKGESPS
jgi:hypothetical protein